MLRVGEPITLPDERARSLKWAKEFLRSLCDPKQTPRVPRAVRMRARDVLRHWPFEHELEDALKRSKYFKVEEEK